MEIACSNCRFYAPTAGPSEGGYCRRYPPVIVAEEHKDGGALSIRAGVWPMVASSAWCGEFVPSTESAKS